MAETSEIFFRNVNFWAVLSFIKKRSPGDISEPYRRDIAPKLLPWVVRLGRDRRAASYLEKQSVVLRKAANDLNCTFPNPSILPLPDPIEELQG